RMTEVVAENVRLRNLLNATEMLKDRVLVAELVGVSPDPSRHTIIINRGEEQGVYVGQAVLDADGLMGQVIEVYRSSSKVLLITDSAHAVPVQVVRNGGRSIAEGMGEFDRLSLRYVPPTTDIVVGDKLVSSGLGGRFPVGYPVGTVTAVQTIPGESYLEVKLVPAARIDRSRHLLLLFSEMETLGVGDLGGE
ncbi:rod shape-determining protein MreC, partial [Porticoccus sp.]